MVLCLQSPCTYQGLAQLPEGFLQEAALSQASRNHARYQGGNPGGEGGGCLVQKVGESLRNRTQTTLMTEEGGESEEEEEEEEG